MAELTRWKMCETEPLDETDDEPVYSGMLTDPDGNWVHWEEARSVVASLTAQLEEATGLLASARTVTENCDENDPDEARQCVVDLYHLTAPERVAKKLLARAPADAGTVPGDNYACADMQGPTVTDRQAAVMWMKRAESAAEAEAARLTLELSNSHLRESKLSKELERWRVWARAELARRAQNGGGDGQ